MEFKDYYEIMELKRDATQDESKRAYHRVNLRVIQGQP